MLWVALLDSLQLATVNLVVFQVDEAASTSSEYLLPYVKPKGCDLRRAVIKYTEQNLVVSVSVSVRVRVMLRVRIREGGRDRIPNCGVRDR